jgi:hypothetical protein
MTDRADGSVTCSCGVDSPRFGTSRLRNQWAVRHRREFSGRHPPEATPVSFREHGPR